VWCSSHMYLQSPDVSACRDADLIGAKVSWSPLVLLLERASVNLGLSRFDTSSSSKNRRLRIRLRSTMRDPNTIYHFEALGVNRCCAHDPSVNSPQARLNSDGILHPQVSIAGIQNPLSAVYYLPKTSLPVLMPYGRSLTRDA
jgi:hypothetical protein